MSQISFKTYGQGQAEPFLSRLDEYISEEAPISLVNRVLIRKISQKTINQKGDTQSAYKYDLSKQLL